MNNENKQKYRKVFILILFALLWVLTGKIFIKERKIPEIKVKPAEVTIFTSQSFSNTVNIEIPVTTEALKIIDFKSERSGRVVEVRDIEGDIQEKGTLIVGLDIDDTKQSLESAKASLKQSKLDLEIARKLNKEGYRTKLELSASEASYRSALQQFESAKIKYEQSFIKIPYKVYVDEILVQEGDYVSSGDTVARVMDLSQVNTYGYITEKNINFVTKNTQAVVKLANGSLFDAKINFVSRFSDSSIHTYKVGALINSNYEVPHGMSGVMVIKVNKENTHLLSFSSLFLGSNGIVGVKALNKDNKVIFLPINSYTQTTKGVVVEGLPQTVRVIVSGQALVSEGDEVNFIEAPSPFIADLKVNKNK